MERKSPVIVQGVKELWSRNFEYKDRCKMKMNVIIYRYTKLTQKSFKYTMDTLFIITVDLGTSPLIRYSRGENTYPCSGNIFSEARHKSIGRQKGKTETGHSCVVRKRDFLCHCSVIEVWSLVWTIMELGFEVPEIFIFFM